MCSQPILYETHSHTPLCKHAEGEPEEYAAVAESRGLRGLIVTCHNPMPEEFGPHVRMSPHQMDEYCALVARAREAWEGRVDVRLGLEADFLPGQEAYLERQLGSAQFHYVLGSVHSQVPAFRQSYWSDDLAEVQGNYFRLLADAAETGLFDCLSHPDLVKNQTSKAWRPEQIMPQILIALDRIAATKTALELNTSGANKTIPEMNPFPAMLMAMREREIPVVIGADAHRPTRVGDRFGEALDLLERCGYDHVSFFLGRQRQNVRIAEARRSLSPE